MCDDQTSERDRIVRQASDLAASLLNGIAAHGAEAGVLDPQVVISALGSTVIGFLSAMKSAGTPPALMRAYAQVASAYFATLPDEIADLMAGKQSAGRVVSFSVRLDGATEPTHDGGRA